MTVHRIAITEGHKDPVHRIHNPVFRQHIIFFPCVCHNKAGCLFLILKRIIHPVYIIGKSLYDHHGTLRLTCRLRDLLIQVRILLQRHRLFGCIRSCCVAFIGLIVPVFLFRYLLLRFFFFVLIRPGSVHDTHSRLLFFRFEIRLHLCKYKSRNHTEQHSTCCHSRHTYRDFSFIQRLLFHHFPVKIVLVLLVIFLFIHTRSLLFLTPTVTAPFSLYPDISSHIRNTSKRQLLPENFLNILSNRYEHFMT